MGEERQSGGFLPPIPPGPEPDLGAPASAPPPPSPSGPIQQPFGPSSSQQPGGWQPAYAGAGRVEPHNGDAVTGFVLSVVSGGLLVLSFGISSIVSVAGAVLGIVYSRRGRRRVELGETHKHAGLAQAGYVVGTIALVMSVLATLSWGAWLVV